MKHTFLILDMTNSALLATVRARTERGAILVFRRSYVCEYHHPHILSQSPSGGQLIMPYEFAHTLVSLVVYCAAMYLSARLLLLLFPARPIFSLRELYNRVVHKY